MTIVQVRHSDIAKLSVPALFVPIFENDGKAGIPGGEKFDAFAASLDELLSGLLSRLLECGEMTGKFKEFTILHPEKLAISHLILVGVGKRDEFQLDRLRSAVAKASRIARRLSVKELAVPVGDFLSLEPQESAMAAAEGALLGLYRFDRYKQNENGKAEKKNLERLTLVVKDSEEVLPAEKGGQAAAIISSAVNFTRDLVNEPSNVMTPSCFAQKASEIASECGLEIQVLEREEIEKLKMGAFLSVAKGSSEPPKLIILKYKGDPLGNFTLGLVGKGVTFDSGGISIKPSENMQDMTCDMAGAAACLGALKAIAGLRVPINVTAVLPLAENLPDGKAYKPGDIIASYAGKTIEVINTDAEGRLLLCDALAYIRSLGVNAIVDLATLTGGVMVALGTTVSGLFSNHDDLKQEVLKAGERASEYFWPLPLFDAYKLMIKGSLADLKNSPGRYGSPCTAAFFLKEFIGDVPWAHLDIAGTALVGSDKIAYKQQPYLPKEGATGVGVRTLTFLALRLSEKQSAERTLSN